MELASPDISSDEESFSPKEPPTSPMASPKELPGTPTPCNEALSNEATGTTAAMDEPLTPTDVLEPSPCPPLSPRSCQKEERLDAMKLALAKLDFDVTRRTAEYRRENGDYFEGDTPRTSQEEETNSEYRYSQRSVSDITELPPLVEFIMEYVPLPRMFQTVGPTVGMGLEAASSDPPVFTRALTAVLNCEPRMCLDLLELAVRAAESEAEEGLVRAMLRGALP